MMGIFCFGQSCRSSKCCLSVVLDFKFLYFINYFKHNEEALTEKMIYQYYIIYIRGPGVVQWLRHCATSRTVSGSILGGFSHWGFFPQLPTKPCTLGSTQLLKTSTRDFSGGKGGRCVRLTTYHPRSAERQENPGP